MTAVAAGRLAWYMQQWRMDPAVPEQLVGAQQWMEYVDYNRYYATGWFMPYSLNGVRGILLIVFMWQDFAAPGDDVR